MRYLFNNLQKIKKRFCSSEGILILLDFDGTLSPIVSTPSRAILSKGTKSVLLKCSKFFPIVVISGRSLKDIKMKVGLKNLIYAGNHGLEWQIKKKINYKPVPKETIKLLLNIKQKFWKMEQKYPGISLEDKHFSLAIHYRQLDSIFVNNFKKDADKIIKSMNKSNILQVLEGKKVIELRPNLVWNKGKFALFIHQYFQNKLKLKLLPVYVGDDKTDEDVFSVFDEGIAIRVGQNKTSCAKYYLRNVVQVKLFLSWLLLNFSKR